MYANVSYSHDAGDSWLPLGVMLEDDNVLGTGSSLNLIDLPLGSHTIVFNAKILRAPVLAMPLLST